MNEFWYYAEGNETRGPIAFDQLLKLLSQLPPPRGVLVWREGFADWTATENVREIAEKLIRPPPLPQPSVSVPNERVPVVTETTKEAHTRGRRAFFIVLMIVLLVGGYFTNQVYGNSTNGIAYLIGQLFGTWFLFTALTWWWRKSPYTAAAVLAVAAISVGFSNRGKLQEAWDSKIALQAIGDPTQLDKALSQNPENKMLKLFAIANKIAEETTAATTKLSDEIEPVGLSKEINFTTATRNDLEALRRDLKTAETNTTSFIPRYLVLLKDERDKIETSASSLNVDRTLVTNFLKGFDQTRVKGVEFNSSMMVARSEAYRAYGNYVEFLIGEFDNYKVDTNGKFLFAKQAKLEKFNVLASTMNAALRRVATKAIRKVTAGKARAAREGKMRKARRDVCGWVGEGKFMKWYFGGILFGAMLASPLGNQSLAAELKPSMTRDGRVIISISGEIVVGDTETLKAAIKVANDAGRLVSSLRLNSIGGNLLEGVKLAEVVKFAKMATNVGQGATCASACFLVFAAGETKFANYSAKIGVHGASDQMGEESGAATVSMARVAKELGVPPAIIGRMVVTPPSEMVWLSPADLQSMGTTMVGKPTQLPSIQDGPIAKQTQPGAPVQLQPGAPAQLQPEKPSAPVSWKTLVSNALEISSKQNGGKPKTSRSCQPEAHVCTTAIILNIDGVDTAILARENAQGTMIEREICTFNDFSDIRTCMDFDSKLGHRDMKDSKGVWSKVGDE